MKIVYIFVLLVSAVTSTDWDTPWSSSAQEVGRRYYYYYKHLTSPDHARPGAAGGAPGLDRAEAGAAAAGRGGGAAAAAGLGQEEGPAGAGEGGPGAVQEVHRT